MPNNELIAYTKSDNASPAFAEVISHLTPEELSQLAWPKASDIAEQLFLTITHQSLSATEIYKKLADLQNKEGELRPHLLLLLHGFENEKGKFQITQSLFETIHFWIEANEAKRLIKRIEVIDVKDNSSSIPLPKSQREKFQTSLAAAPDIYRSERSIFKCYVGEEKLLRKFMNFALFLLADSIPDQRKKISILENLPLFKQYFEINDDSEFLSIAKAFIDHCENWYKNPDIILNINLVEDVLKFFNTRVGKYLVEDTSIFHQLMVYDTFPLHSYSYDNINEVWYFIFIGSSKALEIYLQVQGFSPKEMNFVYGKIKPLELIDRRLDGKARLGNFRAVFLNNNAELPVIHNVKIDYPFSLSFHDRYHQMILSVLLDVAEELISSSIKLIRSKTGLNISKELWQTVDSDFSIMFSTRDPVYQLEYILCYSTGVMTSAMILNILRNNFYNLNIPDNNPDLHMLNSMKHNFSHFNIFASQLAERLQGTEIDIDLALLIYIRIKHNTRDLQQKTHFDRVFLALANTLKYRFSIDKTLKSHGKPKNDIQTFFSFNNRELKDFTQIRAQDVQVSVKNLQNAKPYYGEIYRKSLINPESLPLAVKPFDTKKIENLQLTL